MSFFGSIAFDFGILPISPLIAFAALKSKKCNATNAVLHCMLLATTVHHLKNGLDLSGKRFVPEVRKTNLIVVIFGRKWMITIDGFPKHFAYWNIWV